MATENEALKREKQIWIDEKGWNIALDRAQKQIQQLQAEFERLTAEKTELQNDVSRKEAVLVKFEHLVGEERQGDKAIIRQLQAEIERLKKDCELLSTCVTDLTAYKKTNQELGTELVEAKKKLEEAAAQKYCKICGKTLDDYTPPIEANG